MNVHSNTRRRGRVGRTRPSRRTGDSGRRPGRPVEGDKRRAILDAALRTFSERGYHGTAVPDVARAAGVATGSLYHYFANKEALVNEVFRDAKLRLRAALVDDMISLKDYDLDLGERWFKEMWRRLVAFAQREPDAFRFLEMQDHAPYLDVESRQIELSVLAPLLRAGNKLHGRLGGAPPDVAIALLWGAFVGLVKAARLGYIRIDDRKLEQAASACWRMIAPEYGSRASGKG
jgi:AcrR family transcriptional regulator